MHFRMIKRLRDSSARLGELTTPHGIIQTPVFMPVGTQGSVKAMRPEELKTMGAEILLGNAYHLYLRPGESAIRKLGGLHRFMNWSGPLLTDSGGYQVFSLGRPPEGRQLSSDDSDLSLLNTKLARVTDEGVEFRSHIDGSLHWMTPERSIEIQEELGADIMMVFDDCTSYPASLADTRLSLERTINWERRSLRAQKRADQGLFAIVQGGMYPELRKECVGRLLEINEAGGKKQEAGWKSPGVMTTDNGPDTGRCFSGFAIGGLSVGEPINQMYELAEYTASLIPSELPHYLMGVGMPEDIIRCVDMGIDMFDCVIPTRNARNGMLFTKTGFIQIKQAQYAGDANPIDSECGCYTCRHYSRAYLRHIHLAKEILSSILSSIHNLHYYLDLLREVRLAISEDRYVEFKRSFLSCHLYP